MNSVFWHAGNILGELAVPKLVSREISVLLILAASLLVFRTLRERCLMVWIVGWIAYFVSHHVVASSAYPFAVPVAQAEFILAVALFVAGSLIYANARFLLAPLLAISLGLIAFAALRSVYWPASVPLHFALELSYHLLTLSAAILILRFRRARREIGSWILVAGLLLLHLDWWPASIPLATDAGTLSDMLLGLGMLLVVFDESRLHTRRLATLNALTTSIARVSQDGSMAATALKELKDLMGADAAWFRLLQENRLIVHQQFGLSPEFLSKRSSVAANDEEIGRAHV